MVICGLESIPAKTPTDYEQGLVSHAAALRRVPKFENCLFIVCPESNLGFESSHIARVMSKLKFTVIMYESTNGQPGLHTSHKVKEVICSLLNQKLDENAVDIYKHLVSVVQPKQKVIDMLLTQVQNYSIIYAVPDKMSHFQSSKKTYSGKHQGQDDLAMMLQFNLLVHQRFFKNQRYNRYW